MGLTLVTPAAATYPVTLAEAKSQCRVDSSDDDTYLETLIAAATDHVEQYTGRAIISQTWKLTLDAFSDSILLPKGPVQSVSSVTYYDTNGDEQTLSADDYTFDGSSDPQWIVRNSDASWPTTLDGINAVSVTFVAGYSTVPPSIRHAILLLISQWFDQRSGTSDKPFSAVPHAVDALLANYRSFAF